MSDQFVFEHVQWQPVLFGNKDFAQLIKKWNLDEFVTLQRFSYDAYFDAASGDAATFLSQCLSSAVVQQHLRCSSGKVSWSASGAAGNVKAERLSCTVTSMEFFDRLMTGGVVKETGSITKCPDEFVEGLVMSDELHKAVAFEDCDSYELFSTADRQEFIFRVLKHLTIGGGMCQFDDEWKPYADTVLAMYKDLVAVQRSAATKQIQVMSSVYEITQVEGFALFPRRAVATYSAFYAIIDPLKRHVTFWHNPWLPIL